MKKITVVAAGAAGIMIGLGALMMMGFSTSEIAYTPNTVKNSVVQPVKFGHANVYFIKTEHGHILVDTGMPGDPAKLDQVFALAGVDPQSIQLIIVTHGHLDHIGLLAYAQEITGAKVLCHQSLSKKLPQSEVEAPVAQNLLGHFLNFMTGLLEMTGGGTVAGVTPDILMEDNFDLGEYGLAGKVVHTPGHSLSSVSIILDNGEALIADMVRPQGEGDFGPGMFYEDKPTLIQSLEKVASFEAKTIYLSHGDHIDNVTLNKAIAALKE